MKKRVLSLLMASAMIVGLTACGSSNEPAATASTDSGNTAATTAEKCSSRKCIHDIHLVGQPDQK